MISAKHKSILDWYDSLDINERAALEDYLMTGDPALILTLLETSERLNRFYYLSIVHHPQQLSLEWW